jgi:predicted RNase H-like HicB family nuclease
MDAAYYSLIRRTADGEFVGWVPDLPGVGASGASEAEVIYRLSRDARELLDKIVAKGLALPAPSATDALPLGDQRGPYRRLLLVLG